jgi:FMN phosphatase YigB (HAD superfamily)
MPLTHLWFGLHGTLIDAAALADCTWRRSAALLAERYGGDLARWQAAGQRLRADWHAYHADLNFSGDDGMADYAEALYRVARAWFRLAQMPEPPPAVLRHLAHELPALAPLECPALYPDAAAVLPALAQAGYALGIVTHALAAQARAILAGSGAAGLFQAPIIGADTAGQFERDEAFLRLAAAQAQVAPAACAVIDAHLPALEHAARAGMMAVHLQRRPPAAVAMTAGLAVPALPDCYGLPALLAELTR